MHAWLDIVGGNHSLSLVSPIDFRRQSLVLRLCYCGSHIDNECALVREFVSSISHTIRCSSPRAESSLFVNMMIRNSSCMRFHGRGWSKIPHQRQSVTRPLRPLTASDSLNISTSKEGGGSFDRIMYLQRSLEAAISAENYDRAAICRDELKTLLVVNSKERPIESYWITQIKLLRDPDTSVDDKTRAINSLGATGSSSEIVPILALYLLEPQLQDAAQTAMWTIWMRPINKDTKAGDAMKEGAR